MVHLCCSCVRVRAPASSGLAKAQRAGSVAGDRACARAAKEEVVQPGLGEGGSASEPRERRVWEGA